MKEIILILTLILSACTNLNTSLSNKSIIDSSFKNEYISYSTDKTLVFLETNSISDIRVFLGSNKEKLLETNNFSLSSEGIILKGLEEKKEYYYQVFYKKDNNQYMSPTYSFYTDFYKKVTDRPHWPKEAIFYEVFVRSFYDSNNDGIGDIKGLEEKLSYLEDLGINALWLMPINPSPSYHGYDVTDYKDINSDYGSLEDFQSFLQKAKEKDIKVIIDLVINHTSTKHPWFQEEKDYYLWADKDTNYNELGSWNQKVWHGNEEKYYGVFWDQMPDLNFRNPLVRSEIKDIAKFWLDLGVDGFRLDASKYIDKSDNVNKLWWHEFNAFVKNINKEAFIIGENWDTSLYFLGSYMDSLDSSFNFKISDEIVDISRGVDTDIIKLLKKRDKIYSAYNENFIDSIFLRNHDQNRLASELLGDERKIKLALNLLFTLDSTPFLYYGEELGQKGRKPDENIREGMDWYKDARGQGMTKNPNKDVELLYTLPNDNISLEEQKGFDGSIYEHTKLLIKIRKENPIFVYGTYETLGNFYKVNFYKITHEGKSIYVAHNSNNKEVALEVEGVEFLLPPFSSIIVKDNINLLEE